MQAGARERLLSVGSVAVPIHRSATNVAGYAEKRTGDYTWSGTMTLRAVAVGHRAPVPAPQVPVRPSSFAREGAEVVPDLGEVFGPSCHGVVRRP